MTSRRDVLKAGLAASAWPIAAGADGSMPATRETVRLYKVLYDTRFPESVAFARGAARHGLAVQAMSGDVTAFWYHDLYHRWLREPAAIAGLTAHGALFCLERLAWDRRMRVVYRGTHSAAPGGRVAHRFEGPAALVDCATDAAQRPAWAAALADAVAECPRGLARLHTAAASTEAMLAVPAEELFSWVIAPVQRG